MVHELIQLILDEAEESMDRTLKHLNTELSHIRAGRATPTLVEDLRIEAYGSTMPLNQMSTISAPSHDLLVVQPWDKSMLEPIKKAIQSSTLGLNPSDDGTFIRIPIPPLSEERRRELAKIVHHKGEDAKVALRNIRRSAKDDIKKSQKEDNLPEDMRYEGEDLLQKLTDDKATTVNDMLTRKETEIMAV